MSQKSTTLDIKKDARGHLKSGTTIKLWTQTKLQEFRSVAFREGVSSRFFIFSGVESLAKTIGWRCATCCAYFLKRLSIFRPASATGGPGRPANGQTLPKNRRNTSHNVNQSFSQGIPPQKKKNAKTPLREMLRSGTPENVPNRRPSKGNKYPTQPSLTTRTNRFKLMTFDKSSNHSRAAETVRLYRRRIRSCRRVSCGRTPTQPPTPSP